VLTVTFVVVPTGGPEKPKVVIGNAINTAHFKKWPKWRGCTRGKYFVSLIICSAYAICLPTIAIRQLAIAICLPTIAIRPPITYLPAGVAAFSCPNKAVPGGKNSGVFPNKMLFLDVY
jgi:hypothetical protein